MTDRFAALQRLIDSISYAGNKRPIPTTEDEEGEDEDEDDAADLSGDAEAG